MVFTSSVTADKDQGFKGQLALVRGVFGSGGDTSGTIATGLSDVKAFKLNITSGTVTAQAKTKPNVDKNNAAAMGSIGVLLCANNLVGTWWALGPI